MRVVIQLIRDNGDVVLQVQGDACAQIWWAPGLEGTFLTEEGWRLAAFSYEPVVGELQHAPAVGLPSVGDYNLTDLSVAEVQALLDQILKPEEEP